MVFGHRTPTKRQLPVNNNIPDNTPDSNATDEILTMTEKQCTAGLEPPVASFFSLSPSTSADTASSNTGTDGTEKRTTPISDTSDSEAVFGKTYKSRETEIRGIFQKINIKLDSAKNLRTDIKVEVKAATKRLQEIVKDLLNERKDQTKDYPNPTRRKEEEEKKEKAKEQTEIEGKEVRNIINKIEEQKKLIEEGNREIQEIKKIIKEQRKEEETTRRELKESIEESSRVTSELRSYASVVATGIRPGDRERAPSQNNQAAAKHAIIITSNGTETSGEIIERIRTTVNAKTTGVRVDRIRKARDQKVVLGCETEEELEKVKERLKLDSKLRVEKAVNKDPLVILRDVLCVNTDEEIITALKLQNKNLMSEMEKEEEERISIRLWAWKKALQGRSGSMLPLRWVPQKRKLPGVPKWHKAILRKLHTGKSRQDRPQCLRSGLPDKHLIIQANLQRKDAATSELIMEGQRRRATAALVQEPYIGKEGRMKAYRGTRIFQCAGKTEKVVKAAIVLFDTNTDATLCPDLTTPNIVVVKVKTDAQDVFLVSFYFEPAPTTIDPYLDELRKIRRAVGPRVVFAGDANAKNSLWGGEITDRRGEDLMATCAEMGLYVLNEGTTPTFDTYRGGRNFSSFVDLTFCTEDLLGFIDGWEVDEGLTSSDHNGIVFKLRKTKLKGVEIERTTRIYNTGKAHWSNFREKISQMLDESNINKEEMDRIRTEEEIDRTVHKYIDIIKQASDENIPKIRSKSTLTISWWTEELASLKKELRTRKRRIRCAAQTRRAEVVNEYLKLKEKYEKGIEEAKLESWKEFCGKQSREGMWEGIYRVINRTTIRREDMPMVREGRVLEMEESAEYLVQTFFPDDVKEDDSEVHRDIRAKAETINERAEDTNDPPFTEGELKLVLESFNPKKAPGLDGLTFDICRAAIFVAPHIFLALINKCLEIGFFPTIWKEATVVVLRKPGRADYTTPKSYRPIGLLPVMGKIMEKMFVKRANWYIMPRMSARQYGFMPQRGTEDALFDLLRHIRGKLNEKKIAVMVSLDIEGAFDSAWWPAIRCRLAEVGCPVNVRKVFDSYLRDRKVRLRYGGREVEKANTKGCIQGSIGGPILWNLLLDPLLKGLERKGVCCQAFADDVVLVFDGHTAGEIERQANTTLAYVQEWGVLNKLKFAPHKTKAMVITRKLKHDAPRLSMGGTRIDVVKEVKLLGLIIDESLTFNTHVKTVCAKAYQIYRQLARAAKIGWGLDTTIIRTIYTAVIEPILMYAASAWEQAARKKCVKVQLDRIQRLFLQKICKAYRTVSLHSGLVLTGLLPLNLRIEEAGVLYKIKRGLHPLPELDAEPEGRSDALEVPHPADEPLLTFTTYDSDLNIERQTDVTNIFTDGSKSDDGVGAAVVIYRSRTDEKSVKIKLASYCSVFQAEMVALHRAFELAEKEKSPTINVCSDSRSALEDITSGRSLNPLTSQIRQTVQRWEEDYQNGGTASTTKIFLPTAAAAFRVIKRVGLDGEATQALTGHGGFAAYLHRFKRKDSPVCACGDEDETVPHLLIRCPIHALERHKLENRLDIDLTEKEELDRAVEEYTEMIKEVCEESLPKLSKTRKLTVPWWTQELTALKKQMKTEEKKNKMRSTNQKTARSRGLPENKRKI
ncbi:unnamed protein product [Leptosia nina]|uniref:Reverse transcriptase domain-containing protein n=1 Tax=Leptosia nina TaxID=320188 RepID=A0AAV1JEE3_9NEOP